MIALAVVVRSDRERINWRRVVVGLVPLVVEDLKQAFGQRPCKPLGGIEVQTALMQASLNRLTCGQVA
jgi:hypothetical protein